MLHFQMHSIHAWAPQRINRFLKAFSTSGDPCEAWQWNTSVEGKSLMNPHAAQHTELLKGQAQAQAHSQSHEGRAARPVQAAAWEQRAAHPNVAVLCPTTGERGSLQHCCSDNIFFLLHFFFSKGECKGYPDLPSLTSWNCFFLQVLVWGPPALYLK